MKKREPAPPPAPEDFAKAIKKAEELNEIGYLTGGTYDEIMSLLASALKNPKRLKEANLQKAAKVVKTILKIRNMLARALEKREELLELLNEGGTSGWRNRVITNQPSPPVPTDPPVDNE